jgi:hypothetical protein
MTFLNPLLLFGLLAASIPIIIHLLNLRKLKTVEFSSLRFLKELQKTTMRRVKIKQWLLLALRTLMVIALVMAFARPALRGSLSGIPFVGSPHAKTTLVLLVDDSPSMAVRNERGVLFSQAKEAATSILDVMNEGDEVYLLRLSTVRSSLDPAPGSSRSELKKALEQFQPSQVRTPFRAALGVAAKILAESKNYNREIFLITDAQATQFIHHRSDTTDLFDDNVKFFLSDVRSGTTTEITNVGITEAQVISRIITTNKPVVLQTAVQNAGASALRNSIVSLYLDGTRMVQQSLDLQAHSATTPSLLFSPKRHGIQSGYIQLEDDAFDADNKRFFALEVPSSIRVLAVGATANDTQLPAIALELDKDSSTAGLFTVTQTTESQFASFDMNKYDLLVLSGVKDFSSSESERIAQFVKGGGGVLIFPGKESDVANYNTVLFGKLGIPAAQPQQVFGTLASNTFISFNRIDFDHPLFEGLFERQPAKTSQRSIESPRVFTAIQPQVGARGSRSLISLSDGTNFLIEYVHGAGRVLLCAVEAGMTWSDFPLKGIFVPLLYRSGLYLAAPGSAEESAEDGHHHQLTTGEEIIFSIRLKARTDKDSYVLRSPSGIDERIVPQFSSTTGIATFRSQNSFEAGIYELRRLSGSKESELLHAVAVNIAKEETDLRHASDDEVKNFTTTIGLKPEQVRRLAPTTKMGDAILESRFGVELWKYFLALAIALALIEMIIGRESKERRA